MVHIILVKALYQIIFSVLIASLINTARCIKISCVWVTLMAPQMRSTWYKVRVLQYKWAY